MKKLLTIILLMVVFLSACGGGETPQTAVIPAPDFELPNALGGNVSLDDYSGKNILLFFHMAVG